MRNALIITFVFISTILLADGVQPTGAGTSGDPYQVATLDNLLWVSTNDSSWTSHFIQTADIDASDTQTWHSGQGFKRIGLNDTNYFSGSYDGQGYEVSNLFINRPTYLNVGFFGYTHGALVKNLGIVDADITGNDRSSGLVAYCVNSLVINCYSTGTVSGDYCAAGLIGRNTNSAVQKCYSYVTVSGTGNHNGGLVGASDSESSIKDCYARGNVTGTDNNIGGLVGCNNTNSHIENCYSTGSVSGSTYVGGLVGKNNNGATVEDSFWNTQTSGQSSSAGGTGKTIEQMRTRSTYTTAGWDFKYETTNVTEDIWDIHPIINNGYPVLDFQELGLQPLGSGTEADPYQISDLKNLYWITINNFSWSSYFIQTANIYASQTEDWIDGFIPMGNSEYYEFSGSYDGQNFIISGLTIFNNSSLYTGLFGYVANAEIMNIELTDVDIEVGEYCGGLIGKAYNSSVSNCYTTGWVNDSGSTSYIGGLIGYNYSTAISDCYSNCIVRGFASGNNTFGTGGLIGYVENSTIQNSNHSGLCYVWGLDNTGGLVGYSSGSVYNNCTTSTEVSGSNNTGGLIGYTYRDQITQCSSSSDVLGSDHVGGLIGLHLINFQDVVSCYSTGSIQGYDYVGGFSGSLGQDLPYSSSIIECYSTSSVTGDFYVGGFAGDLKVSVRRCFSTGNVSGYYYIGGFSSRIGGLTDYDQCWIENSYSTGYVNGDSYLGGFCGYCFPGSSMNSCYSIGSVSGSNFIGGFCAENNGWIENSFWNTTTSDQQESDGGTGKTFTEMMDIVTFTDLLTVGLDSPWDFVGNPNDDTSNADIWNIDDSRFNNGYPYLSWQYTPPVTPGIPQNVTISISLTEVNINWDPATNATSYKVYSSDDPNEGFTEDTSGTFNGNSWSALLSNGNKFYYVKALN